MAGKGSFIFVIGFGIIMGYIILNLTSMGTRATENMSYYNSATASKNLATIGANIGLAMLYEDDTMNGQLIQRTIDSGSYRGGTFTVTVNQGTEFVTLRSVSQYQTSTFQSLEDEVEVILRRSLEGDFPDYAWYAEAHGAGGNFFYEGDTLWGGVYKDGQFFIDGGVVFHGHVDLGEGNFTPNPRSRQFDARLLGGYTPGAEKQTLDIDFSVMIESANQGGKYIENETLMNGSATIEIDGNQVKLWNEYPPTSWDTPDEIINMSELDGAFFVEGDLYVKGQVSDGYKVTFGASENINIIGNIEYSQNPPYERNFIEYNETYGLDRYEMTPRSELSEFIAFASMNDIKIQTNEVHNDLYLHGLYYAHGALKLDNNVPLGVLDIWGSVIQKFEHGGLGESWLRHPGGNGFQQQLFRFDPRISDGIVPHHFPMNYEYGRLQIVSWYESIQLPQF